MSHVDDDPGRDHRKPCPASIGISVRLQSESLSSIVGIRRKLGIPLKKGLEIWLDFIEICERRNLLVHTGGVVSSQYLAVCRQHNVDIDGRAVGQEIPMTSLYYSNSVKVILEFGQKLTQVVWRKLVPREIDIAEKVLGDFGYRLLTKKKYKETVTIFKFGLVEMKSHGSDATRNQLVVNYANAEKLSGNKVNAEKILGAEDWSAATDDFKICVAAVRDDVETVIATMKYVVEAKKMDIHNFREWPVFEAMKSNPKFIEAFERNFEQKFLIETARRPRAQLDTDTEINE